MKKYITIAALLAAGSAFVNATTDKLEWLSIKFGTGDTLTSGNQAMSWGSSTSTTDDWIIKFSITENLSQEGWEPTITTGESTGKAEGLSVGVCNGLLSFRNGNNDLTSSDEELEFKVNDVLTFAYSDGTAYIGNYTSGKYISTTGLSSGSIDLTMSNGSSRAWSNGGRTKIGESQFADLHGTSYEGNADGILSIVIPEPSTFGLLAGLGALALVGARRRRR